MELVLPIANPCYAKGALSTGKKSAPVTATAPCSRVVLLVLLLLLLWVLLWVTLLAAWSLSTGPPCQPLVSLFRLSPINVVCRAEQIAI